MAAVEDDFEKLIKEMKSTPNTQPTAKVAEKKEQKKETPPKPSAGPVEINVGAKTIQQTTVVQEAKQQLTPKIEVKTETTKLTELPPLPPKVDKPARTFDVEEDTSVGKEVWTLFGHKGHGKTTAAMSFDGVKIVLSFDRKATPIKQNIYNNDENIRVFNCIKYMDYGSQSRIVESADVSFDFIMAILEKAKQYNPDWVIIDGSELMQQICEWKMRAVNQVSAFEGFKNLNLWKERRAYVRQIHNRAYEIANKGIIYTCYVEKDDIVVQGEIVAKKDVPKWIDVILTETDYVLKVEHDFISGNFIVEIVSSKNDKKVKTGKKFIVTGKRFYDLITQPEAPEVKFTLGAETKS